MNCKPAALRVCSAFAAAGILRAPLCVEDGVVGWVSGGKELEEILRLTTPAVAITFPSGDRTGLPPLTSRCAQCVPVRRGHSRVPPISATSRGSVYQRWRLATNCCTLYGFPVSVFH